MKQLLVAMSGRGRKPGLWVAIYGPDGAGKSAVAARITAELTPHFRISHRHHLRIPLLRRRKSGSPVTRPHAQRPRGVLLSHLKLLYLFADYWLAHLLVTVPRLAAGHLVVFDRYFPRSPDRPAPLSSCEVERGVRQVSQPARAATPPAVRPGCSWRGTAAAQDGGEFCRIRAAKARVSGKAWPAEQYRDR